MLNDLLYDWSTAMKTGSSTTLVDKMNELIDGRSMMIINSHIVEERIQTQASKMKKKISSSKRIYI